MLKTKIFMEIDTLKDIEEQEIDIRSELLMEPNNIKLLKKLGALLYFKQETSEAIKIYKKIIEIEGERADNLGYLGYLYYEKNCFEKAKEYLNKALDKEPDTPFIYFLLGNTYSHTGEIEEAIRAFDLAFLLDFDIASAHLEFAIKYERMGRYKRALREYIAANEQGVDEDIEEKIKELEKKISGK